MDPEVGMSVVDLGLIRDVVVEEHGVTVRMVLTFPGCPLAGYLAEQVYQGAIGAAEGLPVEVEVVDEPWTPPWAAGRTTPEGGGQPQG
jgi:serine O-acetyltransferase